MTERPSNGELEPGSFSIRPEDNSTEQNSTESLEAVERKPEAFPDLVEKYNAFQEALHPKIDVVYHPSNATDISPSVAFKNSRVIYAEIDKGAVDILQQAGYESHYGSATRPLPENPNHPEIPAYQPDVPVDVLILLNPAISPEIPSSYVAKDGYVLANDWHKTATKLKGDSEFEIVGIIRKDRETKKFIFDSDQPEDYWKEVETDEEFKNAPFSFGAVSYEQAKRQVKSLTGKNTDILKEYKKIIEAARQEEINKETNEEKDSSLSGVIVNRDGRVFTLLDKLPRKKGSTDDYFVFKRTKDSKK